MDNGYQMSDPTFLGEQKPSFFQKLQTNSLMRYLVIAVLLLSIPFTVLIAQKQQQTQQNANANFQVGFNITGITDYGTCNSTDPNCNDLFRYSNTTDVDADLAEMQKMGATVVRVWIGDNHVSATESANRLDAFLAKAATYNISAIVGFIDFYHSGFNPQGTDQYYVGTAYGGLLGDNFFSDGYKHEYKDFVTTVINQNKNHANIFAWEPGNELEDSSSPSTFIAFMQDITAYIKSLDPNHPVATGMLAAGHTGLTPDALYSNLPNVDIITIHPYSGDRSMLSDVQWATTHGKQAIVEEFGLTSTQDNPVDRSGQIASEYNYWKSQGVEAALQWGFIAKGVGDNGNGDRNTGMDTIWHCNDYNQLFSMYQTLTGIPATTPTALPASCGVVTPTPAATNTKVYIDTQPAAPGQQVTVTATGSLSCSAYILDNPLQTGGGLTGCQHAAGYTCNTSDASLINPKNDGNPCWWQWTCTAGNPGNYTFAFGVNAAQNSSGSACNSTQNYVISQTTGTTPTPSPTPTPTPTPMPTPTLIPTPTFIPGGSQLAFSVYLPGISSTSVDPIHKQRQLQVQVLNTHNVQVANLTSVLTFNSSNRLFQGTTDLGTTLPAGTYFLKIKVDKYLRKLITLPVTLTSGSSISVPQTILTGGDITNDNVLDINDFNYLQACYGVKQFSSTCPDPYAADLNDDGKVDGIDYNILIEGFRSQSGS